jgi:N-acetylneuraminic acid mutarotase
MYVMGGKDNRQRILKSVHRFDPVANSWSVFAPLSVARWNFGAFVHGGRIYAVGGLNQRNEEITSMESYCAGSNRWSTVNDGELSYARNAFSVQILRLKVNTFDVLMAKAERAGK